MLGLLRHTDAIVRPECRVRFKSFWQAGANNRFTLPLQLCKGLIQIKQKPQSIGLGPNPICFAHGSIESVLCIIKRMVTR